VEEDLKVRNIDIGAAAEMTRDREKWRQPHRPSSTLSIRVVHCLPLVEVVHSTPDGWMDENARQGGSDGELVASHRSVIRRN